MQSTIPCGRLWRDQRGGVAVGYVFFVAIALAIAMATALLRKPIDSANKVATIFLADDNP
jgi:hypothetical protein